jgi:hypothetical protein
MTARNKAHAALAPQPCGDPPVLLPTIRVWIEPGEVAAFSRETGGAGISDFVPLSFPFRWLALPAVRGAIMQGLGGDGFLPVHEAQSFAYERGLRLNTSYVLDVEIETGEKPPRLIVKMTVSSTEAEICARLETVLRIVELSREADS